MATNTKKRQKSIFGKICTVLFDVLVIPVIILAFVCAVIMLTAKANNRVPNFFGNSLVTVLSGSMEPEFMTGEMLLIKKVDLDDLEVGDDIAFYAPITNEINKGMYTYYNEATGEYYSKIIFHRIVRIIPAKSDGSRPRYFVCKGLIAARETEYEEVSAGSGAYYYDDESGEYRIARTDEEKAIANFEVRLEDISDPDDLETLQQQVEGSSMSSMQYITDEYVVGEFNSRVPTPIAGFVRFCSSVWGIVCLVIIPSLIMIAYIVVSMVRDIKYVREEEAEVGDPTENNLETLRAANALNEAQKAQEDAEKEEQSKEVEAPAEPEPKEDEEEAPKKKEKKQREIRRPTPKLKSAVGASTTEQSAGESPAGGNVETKQEVPAKPVPPKAPPAKPKAPPTPPAKPATPATKPPAKPVADAEAKPKPPAKPKADGVPKKPTKPNV